MARTIGLLARFGLAGLVNTAVGFAVVVALDPVLGLAPALANAIGYLVGGGVGFALNRAFVFRSRAAAPAAAARYAVSALAAFLLNQAVLHGAGRLLGAAPLDRLAAQATAMATYSLTLFALCRLWVFRPVAEPPAA